MSKLANKPIDIPKEVKASLEGRRLNVSGPLGSLPFLLGRGLEAKLEEGKLWIVRRNDTKSAKSLQGTAVRTVSNNIKGVLEGWVKNLELVGTGYRARKEQESLVLLLGFSHPVRIDPPQGVSLSSQEGKITVKGVDKQLVGQTASKIRNLRPPDVYKGKGIKYLDEVIRKKPGKQAAAVTGQA